MHIDIDGNMALTTESAQSHYNIPVLRVDDDSNSDYGPADVLPDERLAADVVGAWMKAPARTPDEVMAAQRFLMQGGGL